MNRIVTFISLLSLLHIGNGCTEEPELLLQKEDQSVEEDVLFIGVSVLSDSEVWLSGTGGTVAHTSDGGENWKLQVLPGADSLQVRDIEAVSPTTIYALTIGNGDQSRIYKTEDGGNSWTAQFVNEDPNAFYDCMDFWTEDNGFVFSDSFEGEFVIRVTEDGGQNWRPVDPSNMPTASDGEGSFAASGTCAVAVGASVGLVGTGAGAEARVLRSGDRGITWEAIDTPIVGGTGTTGIASISFFDDQRGLILGGDVADHESVTANNAFTLDGGKTWNPGGRSVLTGAFYGSAAMQNAPQPLIVGVGPKGMDYSIDYGKTWTRVDTLTYWSAGFADRTVGWTVGPGGRISKWRFYDK